MHCGSCSLGDLLPRLAPSGLLVPVSPARAWEHFRPAVKWVSQWVSPGGGWGAPESQALSWRLRRWWYRGGPGKVRGESSVCVCGEGRAEDLEMGHRGVGTKSELEEPSVRRVLQRSADGIIRTESVRLSPFSLSSSEQ
ncbi:hypothetical protein LEMLEM_LOCUS5265 [Lemmus lemmus]